MSVLYLKCILMNNIFGKLPITIMHEIESINILYSIFVGVKRTIFLNKQ
jgi:hypothetical protein